MDKINNNQSYLHRRKVLSDESKLSSRFREDFMSSAYTVGTPNTSFQTSLTTNVPSDRPSTDQSKRLIVLNSQDQNRLPNGSIRLVPFKMSDIIEKLKVTPAYRDKSVMKININEKIIDKILTKEQNRNTINLLTLSPEQSLNQSFYESPISTRLHGPEDLISARHSSKHGSIMSPESLQQSFIEHSNSRSPRQSSSQEPGPSKHPFEINEAQQVYAMTDIQAFPMVGKSGFRIDTSRRKRTPRSKSRRKKTLRSDSRRKKTLRSRSRRKISPNRYVVEKPRKRIHKKHNRPRTKSRARSRTRKSRPRRLIRQSPVVVVKKRQRYPFQDHSPCTPYPLCDNECVTSIQAPTYSLSRPAIRQDNMQRTCTCNLCMDKLQFIQPKLCSKKKYMWTNEYAIIPKPEISLIDPCEELDPLIYPRANNPCIRDGRGNPLTDCIGRPLRDPLGKRFLKFNSNGSVMDTSFRGNFTGQPPVCVKCTLPNNSCAPDTTHNWWMSCGYPIRPDMTPYLKHVLATERR